MFWRHLLLFPLLSLVLKKVRVASHQEFRDDDTVLVGEVDCVGSGKVKCKELDIKAYPQVKCLGWGSLRLQRHSNGPNGPIKGWLILGSA